MHCDRIVDNKVLGMNCSWFINEGDPGMHGLDSGSWAFPD